MVHRLSLPKQSAAPIASKRIAFRTDTGISTFREGGWFMERDMDFSKSEHGYSLSQNVDIQ